MVGDLIALIEDGDEIAIDIPQRRLDLNVPEKILAERRAKWTPPEPRIKEGMLARYAKCVTSADQGAVLMGG